jgi:hypothetical protein
MKPNLAIKSVISSNIVISPRAWIAEAAIGWPKPSLMNSSDLIAFDGLSTYRILYYIILYYIEYYIKIMLRLV